MDPPLTPLIKINNSDESGKYFVKLKLRRDPTSFSSDLYGFNMNLFDNGDPEELFLFMRKFNMTLSESGTLATGAKIQYFCSLVHGEVLCQFD